MVEVAGISPNHQAKDGATPAHFAALLVVRSVETIYFALHTVYINFMYTHFRLAVWSGYWIMVGLQKTETTLEGLLYMMLPNRAR